MSSKSSYYNSIFALGATGVDNGKGGGWEKIHGDHAVKLNGRTYHHLNTVKNELFELMCSILFTARCRSSAGSTARRAYFAKVSNFPSRQHCFLTVFSLLKYKQLQCGQ
jgi:hypothetical protein